ncbi:hypothetical protein HPB47_004292 [Ixodes persulcatus]|uniref:Uncharacterized protein n=1 Tax=Ixodes persulcatus TaxID=34615 RepID=A0AC60PG71_IXOPE|nr:hypothetical protein HPB47_004292 [Ixodes persulcatus]
MNRAAEDSNQVPTTATNESAQPSTETNCDHLSDASISNLPECWNLEQGEFFKKENEWLSFVDGKLKCLSCSRVKHLGSLGRISLEWAEGGVKASGDSKQKQQRALRKKIYQHRESDAHVKALEIDRTAKKRKLEEAFSEQLNEHQEATKKIFRIAYKQAKNCRPFSDFSDEIDVQTANGVDIGNEMQKSMCRALIEVGAKFSVLIDESTTVSKHSTLIVYLRSDFGHLQPVTVFLDLVEVTDGTAAGIKEALLTCLSSHGLSMNVLKEKLVAFACDGASVMLGKHSGVAKLLEDTFPNLITWHCSAHRLELAVGDTVRDVQGINHFKIFMDKLYCLYSSSPKNRRELESCAKDLNASLLCVGRVLDTRWVASSFRTVNAVMTSYPSLYTHFMKCSEDPKRDTKEKAQYIGLAERLSSVEFVQNLALLHDSLAELSELSLNFQVRAMTLPEAHNLVTRQIAVFEARKARPGKMSVQVNDAVKTKCFKDIKLHPGRKCDRAINSTQFYQSLADNMRTRLLTTQSSRSSSSSVDQHVTVYRELIEDIRLLDPSTWPEHGRDDDNDSESSESSAPNDATGSFSFVAYFNGSGTPTFKHWVGELERTQRLARWEDPTLLAIAQGKLCGVAADWHVSTGRQLTTWTTWKAGLEEQFGEQLSLIQWHQGVAAITQKTGESLQQYAFAKLKRVSRCPAPIAGKERIEYLVQGIRDDQVATYIAVQRSRTVDDFLSIKSEVDRALDHTRLAQYSKSTEKASGRSTPQSAIVKTDSAVSSPQSVRSSTFQHTTDVMPLPRITSLPTPDQESSHVVRARLFWPSPPASLAREQTPPAPLGCCGCHAGPAEVKAPSFRLWLRLGRLVSLAPASSGRFAAVDYTVVC